MAAAGLWFLTGYLVGSVPIGLLIGRVAGIDIRRYGTGNIGASNVLRNMGLLPAAAVGVVSFAQGAVPAAAAAALTSSPVSVAAAAVGSVAGYGWSWLLHFRGGRAVGTATGALVAIAPAGILPLLGLYAVGGVLRQPAVGVLLGMAAFLGYMLLWPHPAVLMVAALLIVVVVLSKRLEGLRGDLRVTSGRPADIVVGRLLFDRRPGQRLVGPRD
jgi:glycerol-3-phosphate acyltransferase PlsY